MITLSPHDSSFKSSSLFQIQPIHLSVLLSRWTKIFIVGVLILTIALRRSDWNVQPWPIYHRVSPRLCGRWSQSNLLFGPNAFRSYSEGQNYCSTYRCQQAKIQSDHFLCLLSFWRFIPRFWFLRFIYYVLFATFFTHSYVQKIRHIYSSEFCLHLFHIAFFFTEIPPSADSTNILRSPAFRETYLVFHCRL